VTNPPPPARIARTTGRQLAAVVALATLVAGCGLFKKDEPRPLCPPVSVLGDTATLTRFGDRPGRDLVDVLYDGRITDVHSTCAFRTVPTKGKGTLRMDVSVVIEATRGPADRDGRALFDYFVSVTDASRRILNKTTFRTSASFPANRDRLTLTDAPVTLSIPIGSEQGGNDFRVFVGFQLSADELDYNHRRQAQAH